MSTDTKIPSIEALQKLAQFNNDLVEYVQAYIAEREETDKPND